ncbi:MAG: hypothetical protein AB1416_06385, partial [Actinomycetota bacterium]
AARYRQRGTPPSPGAAMIRDALTGTPPGLRQRNGKAAPLAIPAGLAAQVTAAYPKAESTLAAEVRAAQEQKSLARSHAVTVTDTALTQNANGSVTGKIGLTATGGGSTLDAAVSLTGHPDTGALDVGVDVTSTNASGDRVTKGLAVRDLLGGKTPKCPTSGGSLQVTGGVDATERSEERYGGKRVNLGTVREATTPVVKSSARAGIGADGRLQPIAFTVSASLDYSRTAQGLAFFSSRTRVVATGTMTGTVDPVTGQVSGATVTSSVRSSGFDGKDAAAAEATYRAALEKMMGEEVGRLRKKLVDAAKSCGDRYEVTLALQSSADFATHSSTGGMNATLVAARSATPTAGSAATFTATGPLGYEGITFASKIPECTYGSTVNVASTWTATVERTPADRLKVTWETSGTGPSSTATVTCVDPGPPRTTSSVPGQPGVSLVQPTPMTFELPLDGGQQAIGGGFQSGGDGFTHTGTMTVTRRTG